MQITASYLIAADSLGYSRLHNRNTMDYQLTITSGTHKVPVRGLIISVILIIDTSGFTDVESDNFL